MPPFPGRLSISILVDVEGKGSGASRVRPEEVFETRLFQEGARTVRKALDVALRHPAGLRPSRSGGSVGDEEVCERPTELTSAVGDH
eukprot:4288797-Alexandrium_andersonii.AAC.1